MGFEGVHISRHVFLMNISFKAKKQAEIQRTIDELKREVDKRDLDIRILQKNLKEAENVLVCTLELFSQSFS